MNLIFVYWSVFLVLCFLRISCIQSVLVPRFNCILMGFYMMEDSARCEHRGRTRTECIIVGQFVVPNFAGGDMMVELTWLHVADYSISTFSPGEWIIYVIQWEKRQWRHNRGIQHGRHITECWHMLMTQWRQGFAVLLLGMHSSLGRRRGPRPECTRCPDVGSWLHDQCMTDTSSIWISV